LKLLKEKLLITTNTITEVTSDLDYEFKIEPGTCLRLFRHLVARKEISLDMTKEINLNESAKALIVFSDEDYKKKIM
jgi:hypothetical protein